MADDAEHEVPEGAAVLPLIPPELGVHPVLLAALHAVVFFDGSEDTVVDASAAGEALQYMAAYLQRLRGVELRRVREDMACLAVHARTEKWPKQQVQFLKKFLDEYGIGAGEEG